MIDQSIKYILMYYNNDACIYKQFAGVFSSREKVIEMIDKIVRKNNNNDERYDIIEVYEDTFYIG